MSRASRLVGARSAAERSGPRVAIIRLGEDGASVLKKRVNNGRIELTTASIAGHRDRTIDTVQAMMHFDSVTYHAPAVRLVLDTVGADHMLYGSDAPPLTSLKPRALKLIEDLNLPPHERDAVFWRNAARLLKLPIGGEGAT